MADDTSTPAAVAESKVAASSASPADQMVVDSAAAEAEAGAQSNGEAKEADGAVNANGATGRNEASNDTAQATTEGDASATNGTPAPKKGKDKRKSGSGVPEHKKLKTPASKKKQLTLHLDAEPGQLWFAHMRGHQPWPAVICDEDMLPETLLSKRPVSAMRLDGTYRDDFLEGGKSARDRKYAIMFLGTNEFSWQPNTDLSPLDIEKVKEIVASGDRGKKSLQLFEAYEIAAEEHDLKWYKEMLHEHQEALRVDQEEREAKKQAKEEKKEKKARKSEKVEDEDIEMEDAEDGDVKKAKPSKKRKKLEEGEETTIKTPGKKLKVNGPKTPAESATKAKSAKKPKKEKKASDQEDTPVAEEPPMTAEEKREKKQKAVLYLRHRLQKGFLGRDSKPEQSEMDQMQSHFAALEAHHDLEPEIIKGTKIHKVLKGIVRLDSIPRDEEFNFKSRAADLLNTWNKALASETDTPAPTTAATNGTSHDEKPSAADEASADASKTDADVTTTDAKEKEDSNNETKEETPADKQADKGTEAATAAS